MAFAILHCVLLITCCRPPFPSTILWANAAMGRAHRGVGAEAKGGTGGGIYEEVARQCDSQDVANFMWAYARCWMRKELFCQLSSYSHHAGGVYLALLDAMVEAGVTKISCVARSEGGGGGDDGSVWHMHTRVWAHNWSRKIHSSICYMSSVIYEVLGSDGLGREERTEKSCVSSLSLALQCRYAMAAHTISSIQSPPELSGVSSQCAKSPTIKWPSIDSHSCPP